MKIAILLTLGLLFGSTSCDKSRYPSGSPEVTPTIDPEGDGPEEDNSDTTLTDTENENEIAVKDDIDISKFSDFGELCNVVEAKEIKISPTVAATTINLKNLFGADCAEASTVLHKRIKLSLTGRVNFKFVDIRPLALLTQLEDLDLSGNKVTNLSSLSTLKKLASLNLSGNGIEDSMKDVNDQVVNNIDILATLNELTLLKLANNNLKDVAKFDQLTKLSVLDISKNQVSDYNFLSSLGKLNLAIVSGNTNLSENEGFFRALIAANDELEVDYIKILDLPPFISNCLGRDSLDPAKKHSFEVLLNHDEFADLESDCERVAAALEDLSTIAIQEAGLEDISLIIAPMNNLTKLFLSKNDIRDISPIGNLSKLTRLDLSCNKNMTGYDKFSGLKSITNILLRGVPLGNSAATKIVDSILKTNSPKTTIVFDSEEIEILTSSLETLQEDTEGLTYTSRRRGSSTIFTVKLSDKKLVLKSKNSPDCN